MFKKKETKQPKAKTTNAKAKTEPVLTFGVKPGKSNA
jgi:hypothetical protein